MEPFTDRLDRCRDFGDVFGLVKAAAEKSLGRRRAGLMLYLARLPRNIGAYHTLGTNGIVLNRSLLDVVARSSGSLREINSYVFSVLLHEYVHSLGYVDEKTVRGLVREITEENLGPDHPATRVAIDGPAAVFPRIVSDDSLADPDDTEIVPDLERSSGKYIS